MSWLLDVLPTEYRQYEVLRRHPAALASMAGYYADSCVEGARRGYRACRRELAELVPPHVADGVLAAYRQEGFRLAATAREVGLVGAALRGETFPPGSEGPGRAVKAALPVRPRAALIHRVVERPA